MKIILSIGIIIVIVILWQICRNTYSLAWGLAYLYRLIATGETEDGIIVLEEIPNCNLIVQILFNCNELMSITDFSLFTEKNRLVGLQIFSPKQMDCDEMDPMVFKNVTLKKIIESGQKEEEAVWLWYLPEEGRRNNYDNF